MTLGILVCVGLAAIGALGGELIFRLATRDHPLRRTDRATRR